MQLALALMLGAGIWVFVLLLAMSLCRAAKAADNAMEAAYEAADRPTLGRDPMGFDLGAHPRPTRGASKPLERAYDPAEPAAADQDGTPEPRYHPRPRWEIEAPSEPRLHVRDPFVTSTTPRTVADRPRDEPATATRLLSVRAAADLLGISPEVLLAWEARFGYPKLRRSAGTPGRAYSRAEVLALAHSLQTGLSISAAIDDAQTATSRRRGTARTALRTRDAPGAGPE
jgi:hypothetical protein